MTITALKSAAAGDDPAAAGATARKNYYQRQSNSTPIHPPRQAQTVTRLAVNRRRAVATAPDPEAVDELISNFAITVRRLISLSTQGLEAARTDSEWVVFFKLRRTLCMLLYGGD